MRMRLLVAVITAALVAGAVAVSAWADNGAQKVSFNDNLADGSCGGAVGGTPGESFAVIKRDGNGTVSAEVVLNHALPNTRYRLNLIQGDCSFHFQFVTTDGQGHASSFVSAPKASNDASVVARSTGAFDVHQTPEVFFGQ